VPVQDLLFPELPAQEDVFFPTARREVEQALDDRLDLRARVVDPLDTLRNGRGLTFDSRGGFLQVARVEVTAVSGDAGHELGLRDLRAGKLAPVDDHPSDNRPQLTNSCVRLLERKDARHDASMIIGAVGVGQRLREDRAVRPALHLERARAPALGIFLWSRALIWLAAIFALFFFEPNRHRNADRWDTARLHDLGYVTDVWARWDSDFFLRIAQNGYDEASAAFHPLYPGLVAVLGRAFFGHYIIAGLVISLAAALGSFVLLHRLAEERLGAEGARRAVLYLALFPMALFLQAVYSESLFLLLVLGAFALAERNRFPAAGLVAGLAILTRAAGLALLPALGLLAWRSRDRIRALGGLTLALPVAAVYPLVLWRELGDPLAFADAQERWHRHLSYAGPLGGVWEGLVAGWHGLEQFVVGHGTRVVGASPDHAAAENLQALVFLALFIILTAVAWRRFGAPYGLFATASLAIPLSSPSDRWPLLSLPRFGLVIFPFFLALAALAAGRPRLNTAIGACSALFLGVAVVQWALWQWVA
jgi:Mannosyltransferase (PIG-V)